MSVRVLVNTAVRLHQGRQWSYSNVTNPKLVKTNIKTFLRNAMSQDALSVLSIEKIIIQTIPDFNKKVIKHFASEKCRRIDLMYKK